MNLKESQTTELKESWRDEILKPVSALMNTHGGKIYVGVSDSGKIVGVEKGKKLLEDISNKIIHTLGVFVDITLSEVENKDILIIPVPKIDHSVSYQGRFYTRSGSTTQKIKGNALQHLLLKAQNLSWDETLVPEAKWEDLDQVAVRSLFAVPYKPIDYQRILMSLIFPSYLIDWN